MNSNINNKFNNNNNNNRNTINNNFSNNNGNNINNNFNNNGNVSNNNNFSNFSNFSNRVAQTPRNNPSGNGQAQNNQLPNILSNTTLMAIQNIPNSLKLITDKLCEMCNTQSALHQQFGTMNQKMIALERDMITLTQEKDNNNNNILKLHENLNLVSKDFSNLSTKMEKLDNLNSLNDLSQLTKNFQNIDRNFNQVNDHITNLTSKINNFSINNCLKEKENSVFDDNNEYDNLDTPNYNMSKSRVNMHARKISSNMNNGNLNQLNYLGWYQNHNSNVDNVSNNENFNHGSIEAFPVESNINNNKENINLLNNENINNQGVDDRMQFNNPAEAVEALTQDIKITRNRDFKDDSWKYVNPNKRGKFRMCTLEYFHYLMDNAVRKNMEYEKWNEQVQNKDKDGKHVTVFLTSKRFAKEITTIRKLKDVLTKVGIKKKTIGTIKQVSSSDYTKNFFTMEIKGGVNGIVNLLSTFLQKQAILQIGIDLYKPSRSKSFKEVNVDLLIKRANLVMQDEQNRNIQYYTKQQKQQKKKDQMKVPQVINNKEKHDYNSDDNNSTTDTNDSSDDSDYINTSISNGNNNHSPSHASINSKSKNKNVNKSKKKKTKNIKNKNNNGSEKDNDNKSDVSM